MKEKLVPEDFAIPEKLETEKMRLRMLSTDDVVKDYEAVMTSIEHLRSFCDPDASAIWPDEGMTIEEDLRDLERHQSEFLARKAFAYTVMALDESVCLGCVYIDPSRVKEYDAEVYLWARQSEYEKGFEDYLYQIVKEWVKTSWPFEKVVYPGRETSWEEWRKLRRRGGRRISGKPNLMRNSATFYDLDTRDIMKSDIPFYLDYASNYEGDVLELACGTGRVSIVLAENCHRVYGIDLSDEMLEQFRLKYDELPGEVKDNLFIIHGDMCKFNLNRNFSMIIIPFRGFQALVTEEEQRECLKCVHKHLDDNGVFTLNVFKPYKTLDKTWIYPETKQWESVDEATGLKVVKNHRGVDIDTEKQVIHVEYIYQVEQEDGSNREIRDLLSLKFYYREQLETLVQSEGFEIIEEYGWYDKRSMDNGPEMILVCRKKEE